ncbi:hypothetical protein SSUR61_0088 [Streptococcus suis R61]|uniref:Uncharacterized protein n=1 Tax=Streptococcus suis R61 TaxID=996306 RepID=A0AA87K3S2_STRSU|nr:hypothetical protein SSUR61_0088 [Streptococcus suis R61]
MSISNQEQLCKYLSGYSWEELVDASVEFSVPLVVSVVLVWIS